VLRGVDDIMDKIDSLRVTVICENVVANLAGIGEHGFAVYIETDDRTYLFDTGSGIGIIHNSQVFKKDLRRVEKIFLSHGHYDHTGGLAQVLDATGSIPVCGHPSIFDKKYAVSKETFKAEKRFIGIPQRKELLEAKGAVFKLSKDFEEMDRGVYLTGEVPRLNDFEEGDPKLHVERDGKLERDTVPDDQSLILSTKKGLVVLLGCAHAGVINILEHIIKTLHTDNIYAVIGGTHLGMVGGRQLERSIEALRSFSIKKIGFSHCTGVSTACILNREFGDASFYASVGSSLEIK